MSEHFRKSPRAAIELRVHFRRDEPGAVLEKVGRIADLGVGGAFVESERPPPVGTAIVLTVAAPSAWDPLELPGEVRWVSEGPRDGVHPAPGGLGRGFGLAFRALDPAHSSALRALLAVTGYAGEP